MIKLFKKMDAIIIAVALVLVLGALVTLYSMGGRGDPVLHIYINGDLIDTYDLLQDGTITLPIETVDSYNTVIIENGMVWVEDADCPKRNCVHQGPINRIGDIIACPPHKLVLRIVGVPADGSYE